MQDLPKRIDIGTVLNNAIEIYKKTFLVSGLSFLFTALFLLALFFIGINYFIGLETAAAQLKTFDPTHLSLKGTLIYMACGILTTVLIAPFTAGILKMMKDADQEEEEVTISTLFHYVNSPHYTSIISATILLSLLSFGINIGIQKIITDKSIGSLLSMSLSVIFSILTLLTIPNIIFKDLGVINAIKNSIVSTNKNFFQILLLLLIAVIIGYLGLIAFCIGMFFTFPIYFAVQYSIYKALN